MWRLSHRLHHAALLVLAVTIALCGLYWWRLEVSHERARVETLRQTEAYEAQLADAVAEQMATLVRGVDFALRQLRDDYANEELPVFEASVRNLFSTLPTDSIAHVGVIDAQGYLIWSNLDLKEKLYLGDREHFQEHLAGGEDRLFISKPVFGRLSKKWTIQFSRPILRRGRTIGVMLISLSPEYLGNSLAKLPLGRDDVINLLRVDGPFLARSSGLAEAIGKTAPPERPFLGAEAPARGIYESDSTIDQIKRIFAWRRLDDFPLVINVGRSKAVVLGPLEEGLSRGRERSAWGMLLVLALGIGVAGLLMRTAAQQRQLLASEARHRSFFADNASMQLLVDPESGRILDANPAASAFYGYAHEALAAMSLSDINCLPAEETRRRLALARAERRAFRCSHRLAAGEVREVEVYPSPVEADDRKALLIIVHDITERQRLETKLRDSEELHRTIVAAASDAIVVTDADNRIIAVNPAFSLVTGYRPEEAIGKNPSLLASGQHDAEFYGAMWRQLAQQGHWEGEIVNRRKDGQHYVEWLKIDAVRDNEGRLQHYVALFSDITDRKRKEDVVWRQANFDALTGLPNRLLLADRLKLAMSQASRRNASLALLFIDLDRFKPVNDDLGHAVGDALLQQVARRLENSLRDEDTVARLGGDEFVVLLPDLRSADAHTRTAAKVVEVLGQPFRVGVHVVEISCSIGIALYPRDADGAEALIAKADAAMYRAKEAGRSGWRE